MIAKQEGEIWATHQAAKGKVLENQQNSTTHFVYLSSAEKIIFQQIYFVGASVQQNSPTQNV